MTSFNQTRDNGILQVMSSVSEHIFNSKALDPKPQFEFDLTPTYTLESMIDPSE